MKLLAYLLLYLFIAPNGVPYFYVLYDNYSYTFFMGVLLIFISLEKGWIKDNKRFKYMVAYMTSIYILQLLIFGAGSPLAFIRLLVVMVITPYILLCIFKESILKKFINLMVFLSAVSLVLWGLAVIIPSIIGLYRSIIYKFNLDTITYDHMIFISTRLSFGPGGVLRNAGAFSEPGSFGTYLVLALLLNNYFSGNKFNKNVIILILAMITTFSTAVYFGLFFILAAMIFKKKILDKRLLLFIPVFYLSIFTFTEYDFLQDKVSEHYSTQMEYDLTQPTSGRILGARKSFYTLAHFPISGKGLLAATRETDYTSKFASGYGFSGFSTKIGVVGFVFWLLWLYKSSLYFSHYKKLRGRLNYLALLSVLFAQSVPLNSVPFMIFLFSGWYLEKYKFKYSTSSNYTKNHNQIKVTNYS